MKRSIVFAAALTCAVYGGEANAVIVKVAASGVLNSAYGPTAVGDPFSFDVSYDDSTPAGNFGSGLWIYAPMAPLNFVVNGTSYSDQILYFNRYNQNTSVMSFGPPGDYGGPNGFVDIALQRADSNAALPTADELVGKSGTFRFEIRGLPGTATGGSGTFTLLAASVPEPSSWVAMVAGFALIGGIFRHRNVKTRVRQLGVAGAADG